MSGIGRWAMVAAAVVRRPGLWATAVRQMRRTAEPGWWRRFPPAPTPPRDYLRFRMMTQTGSDGAPDPLDVVNYLTWCKRWNRELTGQP